VSSETFRSHAALKEAEEGCRAKSSLSHPGLFTLISHLPLVAQDLPRRKIGEGGAEPKA